MLIFITGATGIVGRRLVLDRLERGDRLIVLSRNAERASRLFAAEANSNVTIVEGDPTIPGGWQQMVDGCDAVIHLAGASIADHRWTASYKKQLVQSRLDSTYQIVSAIEEADRRPRVLVCASAVGYYGDVGLKEVDERQLGGTDFLADLCRRWEEQAESVTQHGARAVMLRIGVVLDPRGGALSKMVPPFRYFIGGPIGTGGQHMPWIHWRDLVGLVDLALGDETLNGPLNAVAPEQVTNRQFSRALGRVLGRPSWLPMPRWLLRIAVGEVAKFLVMSQRVVPRKALADGYHFIFPEIESALAALLRRDAHHEHPATDPSQSSARTPAFGEVQPPRVAESEMSNGPSPAAPIRLLAIDVDGTLLRSDQRLAQGVIQACRNAQRMGAVIVLATARPPRAMRSIVQTLDLNGPTINYNGAVIWNPLDDHSLYHEPLPGELVSRIVMRSREVLPEILVGLEVLDRWYTDRLDHRFETQTSRLVEPDYVGPLDEFLSKPVTKLDLLGPPDAIEPVQQMIREEFWQRREVALYPTLPHQIQITHPMVDKGIALQRIASRMSISRESVMAIGDASNDQGMVNWAGFGVAVENACKRVIEIADAVVPSNDNLGVARAIHRYVLSQS